MQARPAYAEPPEGMERAGALAPESIELARKGKRAPEADGQNRLEPASSSRSPARRRGHVPGSAGGRFLVRSFRNAATMDESGKPP